MAEAQKMKALYVIVNVGFAEEIVEIARSVGATGATIFNARGTGGLHKSILGITIDTEKEIVLSVVTEAVAEKIIAAVQTKAGQKSPACGICFSMPVEKFTSMGPCAKDE